MARLKGGDLFLLASFLPILTPPFEGVYEFDSISPDRDWLGTNRAFFRATLLNQPLQHCPADQQLGQFQKRRDGSADAMDA